MATNHNHSSRLRFIDGITIELGGDLRAVDLHDGWYVVGHGMLIPVADREEGNRLVKEMKSHRDNKIG